MKDLVQALSASDADLGPALLAIDRISTSGDEFEPQALLHATNLLHALGDVRSARALELYGTEADKGPGLNGGRLDGQRAIFAARLLYVARADGPALPAPALGKPDISLNMDPAVCPHCPLVVACDIPFLPLSSYYLGGAPTSAARFAVNARQLGRLRERPLEPRCAPARAVDELVVSNAWRAIVPDQQAVWARSLVYRQAVRAARPALGADELAIVDLAAASAAGLDQVWQRVNATPGARTLVWDRRMGHFVRPAA